MKDPDIPEPGLKTDISGRGTGLLFIDVLALLSPEIDSLLEDIHRKQEIHFMNNIKTMFDSILKSAETLQNIVLLRPISLVNPALFH